MEQVVQNLPQILEIVSYVISIAAVVAAITPNTKDDSIIAKIKKVANVLGLNIYHAKNKDD